MAKRIEFKVEPWTFAATLKTVKRDGKDALPLDEVGRFHKTIAKWLYEHLAASPDSFRFMRKMGGYTQEALADLLGTTKEVISRWENAAQDPRMGAWFIVARLAMDKIEGSDELERRLRSAKDAAKESTVELKVA